MENILLVIDMQRDFVDGALGTPEAAAILPAVRDKVLAHAGKVYWTRDTHETDYPSTREGRLLPVPHCIRGTAGWEIHPALAGLPCDGIFDKPTFGSLALVAFLQELDRSEKIGSICLIGICTDICVISNAMLVKAAFPEAEVTVDARCCAGVTPSSHRQALGAMAMCQIAIENGENP